jgi:hypothetical protein
VCKIDNRRSDLLPTDLSAFVLFFKPALQWLEIFRHCAGGDIFPGRFLQHFLPIFRRALLENVIQPRPDFLGAGIVSGLRRLMQDLTGDVVV